MLDAELGEHVARRLAAIMKPAFDDITAKLDTALARLNDIKGRLLLIEQHYQTCPQAQAPEKDR